MATYPLATLAATITPAGVSIPTYADILASLKASAATIFGNDVYLEDDSQDGQLLAIFALAIHDCNLATVAVYNAFSPATAQGANLSSVVKINHLRRLVSTKSQVNVTLTGVAGTTVVGGVVGDVNGNKWDLPDAVTIPSVGTVTVTATAQVAGALTAAAGTVTRILTPTAGWQSVTNPTDASSGQPVETDADLRARQELSPAIQSVSPLAALASGIAALPGVTYGMIYENDTNAVDANGLPAHSIAVVVKGGVAADIAAVIYAKKAPGVATHGTTTVPVTDIAGVVRNINFFIPTTVAIKVEVTLHPLTGYTSTIGGKIKTAVVDFINSLAIGEDLIVSRLYGPALLNGAVDSTSYSVSVVKAALVAGVLGTTDITVAFSAKATCQLSDVTITLV